MNLTDEYESNMKWRRYKKALANIEDILRIAPEIGTSWYNYGHCLEKCRRPEEAADAFIKAFTLNSEDGGSLYRAASVLHNARNEPRLLQLFETICEADPGMIDLLVEDPDFGPYFKKPAFASLKQRIGR